MELQRVAVHAIAQASRLRTVVEDVAEMSAAAATMDLGAQHAEGAVLGRADGILQRLVKTWPAGAALEFRLRREQRQVATGAGEDSLAMLLEQRTGPGALGALLAQDLILLRRELGTPFRVGLLDFELSSRLSSPAAQPAQRCETEQTGGGREQDTAVDNDGLRAKQAFTMVRPKYGPSV